MTRLAFAHRFAMISVLALAVNGLGCGDSTDTEITRTPEEIFAPRATDEATATTPEPGAADLGLSDENFEIAETEPAMEAHGTTLAVPDAEAGVTSDAAEPVEERSGLEMTPVSLEELKQKIAESDAKYTLVDCWATWCGPCKENFPHVLEMHEKYGDKGLKVASLSFDKGTGDADFDAKQVAAAQSFLGEINASGITNYVLEVDNIGDAFEAFDITTIPAVFLYDSEGNEVKRYTWDDPSNQFTYEQVEEEVAEMLGAE
ncbi:hypothetical protein BH23PLA1_BH23PLA1_07460 [soil metagenome]